MPTPSTAPPSRKEAIRARLPPSNLCRDEHPDRHAALAPEPRLARRSRGPLLGGIWLRVHTRWHAAELDRQLAKGTDPMLSDELTLRVGQLGAPWTRLRLSRALLEAVDLASGRRKPLIRTRLLLTEIHENEELLLTLADRLRDGLPLGVQGLAMAARLVADHSGPLYRAGPSDSLAVTVLETLAALEHGHRTTGTAPV